MAQNRKLVIAGVDLVKVKLKGQIAAMSGVRDELENVLVESNFFAQAPFKWISLIIRFGLQNSSQPIYERINKNYGDLPISVEVDTHPLIAADIEKMKAVVRRTTLDALLHVAQRYNLPAEELKTYREGLAHEST